jgi:gluconolactonase
MRWTQDGGLSVFRRPSGFANGHTRDRQGRLIGCSHQHRCITRTELDGSITVLADRYAGKRLNSPNDVICQSDGTIWFSDPHYGINTDYEGGKQTPELPPTLYRFDPQDGSLQIMSSDFEGPNSLAFSPDEGLLYVAEAAASSQSTLSNISVSSRFSTVANGSPQGRIFHKITPGFADGFRLDEDGNVWSSAADGVHCVAPDGTELGRIKVAFTVSNLAFGGRNRSRLFICASHTLFAIYTNQRGAQRP